METQQLMMNWSRCSHPGAGTLFFLAFFSSRLLASFFFLFFISCSLSPIGFWKGSKRASLAKMSWQQRDRVVRSRAINWGRLPRKALPRDFTEKSASTSARFTETSARQAHVRRTFVASWYKRFFILLLSFIKSLFLIKIIVFTPEKVGNKMRTLQCWLPGPVLYLSWCVKWFLHLCDAVKKRSREDF